jgi:hypothetical protein
MMLSCLLSGSKPFVKVRSNLWLADRPGAQTSFRTDRVQAGIDLLVSRKVGAFRFEPYASAAVKVLCREKGVAWEDDTRCNKKPPVVSEWYAYNPKRACLASECKVGCLLMSSNTKRS